MQDRCGSPEEDGARIIQFYRRLAELTIAERRGLPSRYGRYDVIRADHRVGMAGR